jgi:hypothetical protein
MRGMLDCLAWAVSQTGNANAKRPELSGVRLLSLLFRSAGWQTFKLRLGSIALAAYLRC